MKPILIITLLLLSFIGNSQITEIGGELGLNSSQLAYDGNTSKKTINFAAFATAEYSLFKNFTVLGKLGYTAKGGKSLTDNTIEFETNFNYISLYLTPRIYFLTKNKKVHPYFSFGPSLSYLLSAKANGTDVKNDTGDFDLGVQGGIGIKFNLKDNLLLDINGGLEQGFSKVISISPNKFQNRTFPYIGVGLRHLLK